jgi:hypothetical protein
MGRPEWSLLHAAAREHDASLIVVDSVAYAIPGKNPSDPDVATAYSEAIQPFGIPVLSLAHMNRMGDGRYPFGSVFWHAGARVTWSLVRDGEKGSKLTNRKHNNYEWQGAYTVTSDWLDDLPRSVTERSFTATLAERIAEALADGPMSLAEVVSALSGEGRDPVKRDSVDKALRRGLTAVPKVWTILEDRWRLVGPEAP